MNREESIRVVEKGFENYPKEHILRSATVVAMEIGCPVAIWRLPISEEVQLIVSFDKVIDEQKIDLEESPSGFVFSPFQPGLAKLLIKEDFRCSFSLDAVNCPYDFDNEHRSARANQFISRFLSHLESDSSEIEFSTSTLQENEAPQPNYKELVAESVRRIQDGVFQKVVPARRKAISISKSFDPVNAFLNLCSSYENAFVSLVSIPEAGTWLGATPEVLLEVEEGKKFKTVALAATQKRDFSKPLSETAWTQKEIEEQAMVSRYIINCFKKIRLREFEERGPKTVAAGNLLHLKTDYEVDMEATNFPQLGTVMLDLLHPTSAVAGMPKQSSLQFLDEKEGFDREFFSGYLGPVNIQSNTNIYVNLRCMKLFKDKAWLYAGAGVTEDSNPEKELLETEMKFNTLLNVIDSDR